MKIFKPTPYQLMFFLASFLGLATALNEEISYFEQKEMRDEQLSKRNLATTSTTATTTTSSNTIIQISMKAHAIVLFIIWGVLVDISIVCVRYFKAYKKYLRFHASVMAVANICSIIVVFAEIAQRGSEISNLGDQSSKQSAHFVIGIITVCLIVFQHLCGMITKLNFENEEGSEKVHTLKFIHKVLGYTIYIIAKTNLIIGADMFEKKYFAQTNNDDYWWAKGLGGLYTVQGIIFVSIQFIYKQEPEFLHQMKPMKPEYIDPSKQVSYNSIIDKLSDHRPISEINKEFKDILFTVLENCVFDISDIQHPGGQFLLKHIKGKEISRYFNGGYECEQTSMEAYRHTMYARNFLNQFYIGNIKSDYYNVFARSDAPAPDYPYQIPQQQNEGNGEKLPEVLNQQNQEKLDDSTIKKDVSPIKKDELIKRNIPQQPNNKIIWNLHESRKITESYKVFLFTNPAFKIKTYLPGVRWFGRNLIVTPQIDTVNIHSRNYSIVLAYMEENYKYRLDLIKYFQNRMRDEMGMSQGVSPTHQSNNQQIIPPTPVPYSNLLPLLIKKQENSKVSNGLSKFLHSEVHKLYFISRPIGHGLEIDENSDGEHIIFTAGTGILPFLDLFDYLLKKLIFFIMKERFGPQEAALVNPHNENYEASFGPNFRIKLFCAFSSKAECYGYQIISDLFTFCNEFLSLPWFSAAVRFASSENDQFLPCTKQYFDAQFIDLVLSQSVPSKILICGPPEFNKNISNILISSKGIDPARVQIV